MQQTSEINALLHLLDDPDEQIYASVSNKLLHYGKEIIPNLENYGQQVEDNFVHQRIENLIHQVSYNQVFELFKKWFANDKASLLEGSVILSQYNYPLYEESQFKKTIKNIYQSCWLEINNYLTPLEQINIINSIFYSMFKFTGFELEENKPSHYYVSEVLETRSGNNYSLGILYQILCEMLDIPVFAIQLPRQFILAYFSTQFDFYKKENTEIKIQFFIDPNNGNIYSQNDVDVYLKKYQLFADETTYLPLSNHDILCNQMEALSLVYEFINEHEKIAELKTLLQLKKEI